MIVFIPSMVMKKSKKSVTVFTPTFNRVSFLKRLYESLKLQSNKDFIWLIVDDGSNDNTREIVNEWKKDQLININYIYQVNSGKASAFNSALDLCDTKYFFPVDSDDYLTKNCIYEVLISFNQLNMNKLVGLIFKKISINHKEITIYGKYFPNGYDTLYNFYQKKLLKGDAMLVYYTKVINKFRFPIVKGEKFFPEAYLYDLIDKIGLMVRINKSLYVVEYLVEGVTSNMLNIIYKNPRSYHIFYYSRYQKATTFSEKILALIKFMSILPLTIKYNYTLKFIYLYPFSLFFFLLRFWKFIKI